MVHQFTVSEVAKRQHEEGDQEQKNRRYTLAFGPVVDLDIGWRRGIGHLRHHFLNYHFYLLHTDNDMRTITQDRDCTVAHSYWQATSRRHAPGKGSQLSGENVIDFQALMASSATTRSTTSTTATASTSRSRTTGSGSRTCTRTRSPIGAGGTGAVGSRVGSCA